MDTQSTTSTRALSKYEARILGRASAILSRIEDGAGRAAWHAPMDPSVAATAAGYGRLAEACDMAASALFNVVNCANAYVDDHAALETFKRAQHSETVRGDK